MMPQQEEEEVLELQINVVVINLLISSLHILKDLNQFGTEGQMFNHCILVLSDMFSHCIQALKTLQLQCGKNPITTQKVVSPQMQI